VAISSHRLLRSDPGNGAERSDPAEPELQYAASSHYAPGVVMSAKYSANAGLQDGSKAAFAALAVPLAGEVLKPASGLLRPAQKTGELMLFSTLDCPTHLASG
jgi:hypothetical protein